MKTFEYFDYADESGVMVEAETRDELDEQLRLIIETQSKEILALYADATCKKCGNKR